jgi:hypothetical protein
LKLFFRVGHGFQQDVFTPSPFSHRNNPLFCPYQSTFFSMPVEIVTRQDMLEMEKRLLANVQRMIAEALRKPNPNAWLTPNEVKALLRLSDKQFQRMKRKGVLKCDLLDRTPYFDYNEIWQERKSL